MDSGQRRCLVPGPMMIILVMMTMIVVSGKTENITVAEGETLSLTPRAIITNSIVWKHKRNLVVEWLDGDFEYYAMFKGRTALDTNTGQLTISHVTLADAGRFTVEVDAVIQDEEYYVTVYKKVLKPKVVDQTLACNGQFPSCNFKCESDATGAGLVSYSWMVDGGQWTLEQNSNIFELVKTDETVNAKSLSCRIKNVVSEEESDPFPNPFFGAPLTAGWITFIVIVTVSVLTAIIAMVWKRKKIRQKICRDGQDNDPESPEARFRKSESTMEPLKAQDTTGDNKTNNVS